MASSRSPETRYDPLEFLDKWLKYEPMGTAPIKDTRIIPAKTPLKTDFDRSISNPRGLRVTSEQEFTPTQMVERVKGMGLRLVKVIDLTNTQTPDRYYSPQEFKQHSVEHCKVPCEGHEPREPPRNVYERFLKELKSALTEFSGAKDVVVVHCTSGFNRTGYMLCRYLMTEHKIKYEDAVEAFITSRGYGIEKKEYLDSLEVLDKWCHPKVVQPHNCNQLGPLLSQNPFYSGSDHN